MIREKDLRVIDTLSIKKGNIKEFLNAATVWINKPHVANRRLSGSKIVQITTADSLSAADEIMNTFLSNISQNTGVDSDKTCSLEADLKESGDKIVIIFRHLLPKQIKFFPVLLEAVIYDQSQRNVTFIPLCYSTKPAGEESNDLHDVSSEVTYCFKFLSQDDGNSAVQVSCNVAQPEKNVDKAHVHCTVPWLKETLGPKIQHWTEQPDLSTAIKSLRLVAVDRYYQLYSDLKEKHGVELVKNWTETTDAQKFVYEDIGIATYLLLIWEEERQRQGSSRKQSFVDLGCGNGLLVSILSKEGHPGVGIDIRKRNIWDTFGSDVKLEERPITPSADNLFPDFDWIIGNHSDELTPWIPVIAARSSYSCSYFVLPCCPHDFNCRFNSKVKGESSYRSYLSYVAQVGQACGFQVEEDTLRIPSTKRVCQIGRHRTYPQDQETSADQKRQDFIDKRCALNSARKLNNKVAPHKPSEANLADSTSTPQCSSASSLKRTHRSDSCESNSVCGHEEDRDGSPRSAWTENFKARSSKESVRNCQKVSQETKDRVVRVVFEAVLAADDAVEVEGHEGKRWRKGGSVHLSSVAEMLDAATREDLKSECGGVQTLLRNHSNIFQVSGGRVQLRDFSVEDPWSSANKAKKSRRTDPSNRKISLCWFHSHHPDGCPRTADRCTFAHGEAELRPRPMKK